MNTRARSIGRKTSNAAVTALKRLFLLLLVVVLVSIVTATGITTLILQHFNK